MVVHTALASFVQRTGHKQLSFNDFIALPAAVIRDSGQVFSCPMDRISNHSVDAMPLTSWPAYRLGDASSGYQATHQADDLPASLNQLDLITVGIGNEGNHRFAMLHWTRLTGNVAALLLNRLTGAVDIIDT